MTWKVKISVLKEGERYLEDEFEHSPITLGALPESDLVLDDPFVSGQHAVVMVSRGQMVYRDLSRNGSFIDGQRISEQDLGLEATVDIPPFRMQLIFERDDRSRHTMFRSADVEAARRELLAGGGLAPPPGDSESEHPALRLPPSAPPAQSPAEPPPDRVTPSPSPPRSSAPAAGAPAAGAPATGAPADDVAPRVTPAVGVPGPRFVTTRPMAAVDPPAGESPEVPTEATKEPAVPSIEVRQGPQDLQGMVLALGNEMTIGRADTADLWIPADTVSRRHAVVRRQPDGRYRIEDCSSANGTFVNTKKIKAKVLKAGDEILLGEVLLGFVGEPPGVDETASHPPPLPETPSPVLDAEPSDDLDSLDFERRALSTDGAKILVTARGRIDGYNYSQLGDSLDSAIDDGGRQLLLDLTEVDYVGHTGLGVLVRCHSRLRRLRGEMCLVGPNERIRDALVLTRLDTLFHGRIYPDQNAAIRDLS